MSAEFTTEWLMRREARQKPVTASDGCADESKLHDEILAECRRRQWLPIHGRMDCASTVTVGAPDFVILANGRVLFVECKTKNGKHSTAQLAFAAWARRLGHQVHTVRSFVEFLTLCS